MALAVTVVGAEMSAAPIPYQAALNAAAVTQPSLANIQKNGLVIGNGELNAIVYTSGNQIRLRISKNDSWDDRINTSADPALPKINPATASYTGSGAPPSWNNYVYPTQVPCVEVVLGVASGQTAFTSATLDLTKARAIVDSDVDSTMIRTLAQTNAFYITSSRPLSFIGLNEMTNVNGNLIANWASSVVTGTTNGYAYAWQHIPGDADAGGMDICIVAGTRGTTNVIAVVTSRDSATPLSDAAGIVSAELADANAVTKHEAVWQNFWSASGVQLGDTTLQNWWYHMVYYNRCFATAGANAIGLKAGFDELGGWHDSLKINYNIQQTYCLGGPVNHPEFIQPFIDAINRNLPRAEWLATNTFVGVTEGAFFHSDWWPFEPNPADCATVNKHQLAYMPWGFSWGMQGHMAFNLWEYYQYNPTTNNLNRVWPALKQFGLFYCSLLEQCPLLNGKRRLAPSFFPENGFYGETNTCYDIAFINCGLKAAMQAATLMGDLTFSNRCATNLALLPTYTTTTDSSQGNQTVIEEWLGSGLQGADNHATEAQPVYPADEVNWFSPQAMKDLFARTINHIENITTHANSTVTINVARARLSRTNVISNLYLCLAANSAFSPQQPNGLFYWNAHGYYIAEQVGVARVISELLLQSVGGIIRVFPDWPTDADANFATLRAIGGFLVSADRVGGVTGNVKITSTVGGDVSLLNPWTNTTPTVVNAATGANVAYTISSGVLTFPTTSGTTYSILAAAPATVPTGLAAIAGDAQVRLSWNAASDAASYNVKRSTTSGSGYVTVTNVIGTGVVDATVANGTTYYYVVSATNAFGESTNSIQVSATPHIIVPLGGRLCTNFNQSWKFMLGDFVGAEQSSYDDSTWSDVGLPHSFSQPYFLWPQFYVGYGWYRKHFTVPPEWSGKRIFIEFQAAFQDAKVFVNGVQVGEHLGGYTGFSFDITPYVVAGDNVVAVRLNNKWNARIAPRNGDHTFSGGIYRDVNLVVTDPLHVTWYGTFVTTPTLAANSGASSTVNIQTEIANNNSSPVTCTVETDIEDTNNNVVATVSSTQTLPAYSTNTFNQTTPAVSHPALWSPASPNLYHAVTKVFNSSTNVDTFNTTFGFRWFTWSATSGFTLNGSHLYFHGVDVHQDHAGWGDGVADSALFRDVQMVKEAGFNFIRGSHYPKAPAFADACDQLGVCLWSENCFWGLGGCTGEGSWGVAGAYPNNAADQAPFERSVTNTLAEMIRINRNHPSIVAWSMCNEPFFTADVSKIRGLLTNEVALTHQMDPTRPAALGGCQRPLDSSRIDYIGDVAGYNGDGATQSVFQNDGMPSIVTEYGSVGGTRPGNYDPGWGELSSQLTGGFPTEYSWRSGQALWCMFDHGSIGGSGLELLGIVDYFRLPKRAWYWYRNAYVGVPPPAWPGNGTPAALGLTASTNHFTTVDGTQDAQLIVTVLDANGNPISNNVPVTLTVTSGPGEFPTGPSITFMPPSSSPQSDIAIRDGKAAIAFRTYYSGTSVITASSPGLISTNITITSEGSPAYVPGVTPPAVSHPYSRYTGTTSTSTSTTLALNRPTSASSTAVGVSGNANDGDPNTIWQAAVADTNASWKVALEMSYAVNMIDITFPTNANYNYTISVSSDGNAWTKVVDQSQTSNTNVERRAVGNFGGSISWVRINFTNLPAGLTPALAEVVVGGAQSLTFKTNQLGGTIIGTQGSWNDSGNTREMAMDWDTNTFFDAPSSTSGTNCWVGLDLGTGISNNIIQINYCPRAGLAGRMTGGLFQGASHPDFSGAITLATVATQPVEGALTTVLVTNTTPVRYVRYLSPNGGWGNVAEVEFYGITTPPAAPANLSASARSGKVALLWSVVAGAVGYNVKRSTSSGSGYTTVTNVATTNFISSGLANGTSYYFVVSAVNAYGESANSTEAGATPEASYATNCFWSGAVSGTWDTSTANWLSNGVSSVYSDGCTVVFDDSALGNTAVNLSATRTPASVVVNNAFKSYTISGSAIAGNGSLIKMGSGTLTLSGVNTYTNGTLLNGGQLTLGDGGALGTGPLTVLSGTLNNSAQFTLTNNIVVSGSGAIQLASANNFTLNGTISGNGTLTLGDSGNGNSLYLAGPNAMNGGTIVSANNANCVRITSPIAGNGNVDWVFNNTGNNRQTFDFASGTIAFGSLSGAGIIQGNVAGVDSMNVTLLVGGNNNSTVFSGVLHDNKWGTGPVGLTKIGAGTLALTGADDYSGTTTVSNGELIVSTAFLGKGNFIVTNSATLGVTNLSNASALVSNLTVGAGGCLEFFNVSSTATPLISVSNLTIGTGCNVKITGGNGLASGNTYPLAGYSGAFNDGVTNLQLQPPYGWRGILSNNAGQLLLKIVAPVATSVPVLTCGTAGGRLQLGWPSGHVGWRLQMATNLVGSNWGDVPGGGGTNVMFLPLTNGIQYFRLAYP